MNTGGFKMLATASEVFADSLIEEFELKYVEGPLRSIEDSVFNSIKSLTNNRIKAQQYLGENTLEFRQIESNIKSRIKQVIKSSREDYIIEVLQQLLENSQKSSEHFTLSLWKELAKSLFGKAPSELSLKRMSYKYTSNSNKNKLPKDCFPEKIIEVLLDSHQIQVKKIKIDYTDYVENANKYAKDMNSIKAEIKSAETIKSEQAAYQVGLEEFQKAYEKELHDKY